MKQARTLTLAALSRSQHSQDSSLYSSNMSELDIHVSSLHFEHMFEPNVKLRKLVKLTRMHDKSTHLYIHLPLRETARSTILLTDFDCYWLLRSFTEKEFICCEYSIKPV